MKSIYRALFLSIAFWMLDITIISAQWTVLYQNQNGWDLQTNDLYFVGNTGFAVGSNWQGPVMSKTTNNGVTWATVNFPTLVGNDSIRSINSLYFSDTLNGFAATVGYTENNSSHLEYGVLLKTTDGGLTWSTQLSTKNQTNLNTGFSILFNDLYFSTINDGYIAASQGTFSNNSGIVYHTNNGGNTWTSSQVFSNVPVNAVYFDNAGIGIATGGFYQDHDIFYYGPAGPKIARSTDGGNTWTPTYSDNHFGYVDVSFPTSQIGYAVGDSLVNMSPASAGKLLKTTDGGQTWNDLGIFTGGLIFCIHFTDSLTGFIGKFSQSGTSGLLKTTDGGLTWQPQIYPGISNGSRIQKIITTSPTQSFMVNDSIPSPNGFAILGLNALSCAVDAGPDTTFCQLQGQLHATPLSSGNNYIYSWSPATGLDNPNTQNPNVIAGVSNQQYVVTMTDTVTSCTAYDTVYVSAYYWTIDTIYNCNNAPVILDFGPGASNYFWQYFTDTAGNTTNLNVNTQTFAATQPGTYLGFAVFPGCGALTSLLTVIDSCTVYIPNVWPGDCNYDLIANAADVLHIGLAYNASGATRPAATNGWYAQPMTDWSQNFVNCNYKHADADGNGIVDVNDTLAVSLNYSLTHPYRFGPPPVNPLTNPALELVANYDTVGLQTLVTVDIRLGSSAIPVDSIYGISFRITSDALLIDTTLTVANLNSTWLGTPGSNMFHFRKNFADAGTMDIAECGTDHLNRLNGSGSIGSFLIVTTDNLSGIAICHFDLSEITAVTVSQHYLSLNAVSDSVVIDPSVPAGIRNENAISTFTYYPNPANSQVTIQLNKPADAIEILDMTGRVISSVKPNGRNTTIETSGIANGIYLIRVHDGNSISSQKLTISH